MKARGKKVKVKLNEKNIGKREKNVKTGESHQ